jgi:tetratricopeptide (TPR) repeat protein
MPTPQLNPTPEEREQIPAQWQYANQMLAQSRRAEAAGALFGCCLLDPANLTYRRLLHSLRRRLAPPKRSLALWARLRRWLTMRFLRRAQRRGDLAWVLIAAEGLLQRDPDCVFAYQAMAAAFESAGLFDNAAWCLEQAVAIGADPETTRNEWARLLERQGQFTRAAEVRGTDHQLADERDRLTRELAARPGDFDLAWALANLETEYVRRDLAIAADRLQQRPDDAELRTVHERLTREAQTREIALWQQKADRYPGELSHRFELGVRLLKIGQFDEALAAFQAARANAQLGWRALVYAGYCHLNRRQWRRAEPVFTEALPSIPEGEPLRKEVLWLLAQHAAEAKEWAKAVAWGEELMGLDPQYQEIAELLPAWRRARESDLTFG